MFPARRNAALASLGLVPFLIAFPAFGSDALGITAPTFQANTQLVLVPVTVTDRSGKTIEGLPAHDFTVLDDQTPQHIATFTSEDAPCSVGLVLDMSGSMRYALTTAKQIAHAFLRTANQDDEFTVLTVSTRPEATAGFSADTEALEQNIQSTSPGGMTALLDTVYLGLRRMRQASRPRRALLILSDGMDNYSRHSKSEVMRLALEANVQVYSILLDGLDGATAKGVFRSSMIAKPGDRATEHLGPKILEDLSNKTGGLHFHVRSGKQAQEAAIVAGRALRNQYVIGYLAPQAGTVGKWHQVRVKSNLPKVNVYGRDGYYSR